MRKRAIAIGALCAAAALFGGCEAMVQHPAPLAYVAYTMPAKIPARPIERPATETPNKRFSALYRSPQDVSAIIRGLQQDDPYLRGVDLRINIPFCVLAFGLCFAEDLYLSGSGGVGAEPAKREAPRAPDEGIGASTSRVVQEDKAPAQAAPKGKPRAHEDWGDER